MNSKHPVEPVLRLVGGRCLGNWTTDKITRLLEPVVAVLQNGNHFNNFLYQLLLFFGSETIK